MNELKPYIDRRYRTNPGAEFTGLGGSSLGGLATLAIGIWYPNVFSRLMVMSPSIWWDNFAIYRLVDSIRQKPSLKIWLDTGTAEPGWEQARELINRLVEKGWKLPQDLEYMEASGANHTEAAWAARVEPALRFLFPPAK
jgi:predicted alpha/beta superfamily hydrolase